MFQALICQVTKDRPLRRFATPPLTSGRKEKCFSQKPHNNVLTTFLPKLGEVPEGRRGLFIRVVDY